MFPFTVIDWIICAIVAAYYMAYEDKKDYMDHIMAFLLGYALSFLSLLVVKFFWNVITNDPAMVIVIIVAIVAYYFFKGIEK